MQCVFVVGLRVSEACKLDLTDIKWELEAASASSTSVTARGPLGLARERMVPDINGADRTLRWFIEDVGSVRRRPQPPWRASSPPPAPAWRPDSGWTQPSLFEQIPRDYRRLALADAALANP